MEFLVEFEINIPEGTAAIEVQERENAEAVAAAALVEQGHLIRVWRVAASNSGSKVLSLYSADSNGELDRLLEALPLRKWMQITVTVLEPHPNDPDAGSMAGPGHGGRP